jgi:hypothetical protein
MQSLESSTVAAIFRLLMPMLYTGRSVGCDLPRTVPPTLLFFLCVASAASCLSRRPPLLLYLLTMTLSITRRALQEVQTCAVVFLHWVHQTESAVTGRVRRFELSLQLAVTDCFFFRSELGWSFLSHRPPLPNVAPFFARLQASSQRQQPAHEVVDLFFPPGPWPLGTVRTSC